MKYTILIGMIVVAGTLQVNGQASQQLKNATPEQRAQKITDWMKTNLQLTDEQATSVHGVNIKYANQNESLKEDTSERREKYKKLKDSEAAKDLELKGMLTPEQFNTYLSKKKELQKKLREEARDRKG